MATKAEKIQKIQDELATLKAALVKCEKVFMLDGVIDEAEQKQLDAINSSIRKAEKRVSLLKDKFQEKKVQNTTNKPSTKELKREPQFTSTPNEKWNYNTFIEESSLIKVDRGSMTQDETDYFENYERVAQAYIDEKMKKYEDGKESPITGKMLADAALKTYMKYGNIDKVVPVDMMLSQLQFETFFGSRGTRKGSEKSPFNVGVYDSQDAGFLDKVPNKEIGIEVYFDLMAEDYLSTKNADELEQNFTNETDQRYASDKNYETKIQTQSQHIESFAKKQGLEFPKEENLSVGSDKSKNTAKEPEQKVDNSTYVVLKGETPTMIAKKHGVDEGALKELNKDLWRIWAPGVEGFNEGEEIKIPSSSGKGVIDKIKGVVDGVIDKAKNTIEGVVDGAKSLLSKKGDYIVLKGETPEAIARKHGVDVAELKKLNEDLWCVWGHGAEGFEEGANIVIPKSDIEQKLDDMIDDEKEGETGLGIGAEDEDEYKSQRDNKKMGTRSGDVQCNVTSLAMLLVATNGGDEAGVISVVKEAIKKGGAKFDSSWGLEELLVKYSDTQNMTIFSSSNMGALAKRLFPGKVSNTEIIPVTTSTVLNKFKEVVVPSLKKGAEVIISAYFIKGSGHIVFLRSVKSNGPVLHDPYGICIVTNVYMRNGEKCTVDKFNKYEEIIKRRLSLTGRFEDIKKKVMAGEVLPQDLGANNFYTWSDFVGVTPYRLVITHKK